MFGIVAFAANVSASFDAQYPGYLRFCQQCFVREGDEPDAAAMKARMKANHRRSLALRGQDPWQPLVFHWFTDFAGRPAISKIERPEQ
ncbi:MAG: hypothetical protein GC155_09780 [Alphaproteobacteria bacterium]|nr:hypothetical protein [Alphaproteobacteria bacterium]